jgi:hypothetical protein
LSPSAAVLGPHLPWTRAPDIPEGCGGGCVQAALRAPSELGHTTATAVAWIISKARNRKVFDDITLSVVAMVALLTYHLSP